MRPGMEWEPCQTMKAQQCSVVRAALLEGPKTTTDLRSLGVMSPAARILDLRKSGVQIATGRQGRQGRYVLKIEVVT